MQSVIDYGLTIWGHTSNANVMKIQRFQNRFTRICTQYFNHDISSATLIHNLRWLNVLERSEFLTGVLMYKCMTDQAPNYLSDLFTETRFVHNRIQEMFITSIYVYPLHVQIITRVLSVYMILASGIKYPLISEKHKMFILLKFYSKNG